MNIQDNFSILKSTYLPQIEELLAAVTTATSPTDSTLIDETAYQLATGGKRLRALLPLIIAQAFGHNPAEILPFCAACEMLHNATLVHDDVQDGDDERRGKATVWKKYGVPAAINCGDAMFYYAVLLLQQLAVPAETFKELSKNFMTFTLKVINGQELEFAMQKAANPSLDDYAVMVEGKTSGLFALPIVGAAQLCGASPNIQAELAEASKHLGVLFQIQDDYLDIYGQKGRAFIGSDIAEGKRSYLALYTLSHATPDKASRLRTILDTPRQDTTPAMIDEALAIFQTTNTREAALLEIKRRKESAIAAIDEKAFAGAKELLAAIADMLCQAISADLA